MVNIQPDNRFPIKQHYDAIIALMNGETKTSLGVVCTRVGRCDDEAYDLASPRLGIPSKACFQLRLIKDDGSRVFYFGSYSNDGPIATVTVNDRYDPLEYTPPPLQQVIAEAAASWAKSGGKMLIIDKDGERLFPS